MRSRITWFVLALWCGAASAGLFKDSLTYDIRVVDGQGHPVPAATVWVLSSSPQRPDLRPADLARLVRRYASDADFVFSGDVHPQLWVLRVDPKGAIRLVQDDPEVHGMKRVVAGFAGLKRGYLPGQVADDAPNNSRRKITLVLQRDPAANVDVRMDELDQVRAYADPGNDAEDPMSPERDRRLQDASRKLRALALQLEKENRPDDAAAVYYNLAYLPSVDVDTDAAGRVVATGYTNGYDARNPQRVADRQRALQLARNHPMLEFEKILAPYAGKNLLNPSVPANVELRRAYLRDAEGLIARLGERVWPLAFGRLESMYTADKQFAKGCEALQRWHEFEPSYYDPRGWAKEVASYFAGVRMQGGPGDTRCEIPGVPPAQQTN